MKRSVRPYLPILALLLALPPARVTADEYSRRLTRVPPPSAPRPSDEAPVPAPVPPAPQAALPSIVRPSVAKPALLEPAYEVAGLGRGNVVSFQVAATDAVVWQLVVREVDGPVAQIFSGEGAPPPRINWDGRLIDGGLAWCALTYTYDLYYTDAAGEDGTVAGSDFTLPAYTREDPQGVTFLIPGDQLRPGHGPQATPAGDTAAAARSRLAPVAGRLDRAPDRITIRIEVFARDAGSAQDLGEAVRVALLALLERRDRAIELYVGDAPAAPAAGTIAITTVPVSPGAS